MFQRLLYPGSKKGGKFNTESLFPDLSLSLNFSGAIGGLCFGGAARHHPEDGNSHYRDQRHLGNGENLGVNAPNSTASGVLS